tara:strand:- start:1015 stop:1209 length:195 start_codon:yes stop_codon:yes gene_type:complete
MNYKNYLEAVKQGFEDPCEYQPLNRYCQICDIEENKTYFIDETCICEDCHEEKEIKITNKTIKK